MNGGRFDFDDGGTYCGGWEEGKAHGHGVCTGPQGKGEYAGAWHYGFEVSGVYTWPSGNTYQGQWQNGKRHGLGIEQRGRWLYKGEWTQGYKGRYGHRQSITSQAKYQGTWSAGFHDGYGSETYVDGGIYHGQWLRGMRHGYGIRKSAAYGIAAKFRSRSYTNASLTSLRSDYGDDETKMDAKKDGEERDEGRGGFVLKSRSEAPTRRRRSLSERSLAVKRTILSGLRIKKQHSTGDIHQRATTGSLRSSGSTLSCTSDESDHRTTRDHFVVPQEEHIDQNVIENYKGEWKNDKRCGFGIAERSDGLKYEGEWFNNRKCGYGLTTLKDGTREEGKYKNNILICSIRKKGLLFVRSSKLKERIENAVDAANRAATIAQQKADIAISRAATARERSEQAEFIASQAREDADTARIYAKQFAPEFKQPGTEVIRMNRMQNHANHVSFEDPSKRISYESRDHLSDDVVILNTPQFPSPQMAYFNPSLNIQQQSSTTPTITTVIQNSSSQSTMRQNPYQYDSKPANYMQYSTNNIVNNPPNLTDANYHQQYRRQAKYSDVAYDVATPSSSFQEQQLASCNYQQNYDALSIQMVQNEPQPNALQLINSSKQSCSRMSLTDDHYDQYMMAANPNQTRVIRRNRPSLTRQPFAVHDTCQVLNRRSTLASSASTAYKNKEEIITSISETVAEENRGSLPNISQLESVGIYLRREEAARLASQQRQELQRLLEEEQLLRSNPLRYLFHPALKAWLIRWKMPLMLTVANLFLMLVFYNLLTYEKRHRS